MPLPPPNMNRFTALTNLRCAPLISLTLLTLAVTTSVVPADTFTNPILRGADPWVIRHRDQYVWCQSVNDRAIAIQISDQLTAPGKRQIVWKAPDSGPYSREVWAPEIHFIDERWHIYFAASDGDNANHLAYVLRSADTTPYSDYTLYGPFATGEGDNGRSPNIWAIDMTVLNHYGKRYALWSGWDAPGTDRQFLYIAPMATPTKLAATRVRICSNDDYLWERTEETKSSRGLNEGPQVLQHDGRTFVIFSCAASWLPTYKLGLLELVGEDPLKPSSWKKHSEPVFKSTPSTFGVGHGSFVESLDGNEWWHLYHAKRNRKPGWDRSIFAQPFVFTHEGFPDFGRPVAPGSTLPLPSGEARSEP